MKTAALTVLLVFGLASPTWASGDENKAPQPSSTVTATPNPDGGIYELGGETTSPASGTPSGEETSGEGGISTVADDTAMPPGEWVQSEACNTVSASGCVERFDCPDGSEPVVWTYILEAGGQLGSYTQCPQDPPPTAETTPTETVDIPGEVLKAFKNVALPESVINVQPPGGETLVNLPTILSTSAERTQIQVRLEKVKLDILLEVWPNQFVWHHGDDTSQTTTTPGKPWTQGADNADLITHTYAKTSDGLQLSVDTTWAAQFKVAGQADWRPVDGTVTMTGAPVTVAVLEAKPQLVR